MKPKLVSCQALLPKHEDFYVAFVSEKSGVAQFKFMGFFACCPSKTTPFAAGFCGEPFPQKGILWRIPHSSQLQRASRIMRDLLSELEPDNTVNVIQSMSFLGKGATH